MRNYTIGRIWGIPIRINASLLVFLPVLAWLIGGGGRIGIYAGVIEDLTADAFDVMAASGAGTGRWPSWRRTARWPGCSRAPTTPTR